MEPPYVGCYSSTIGSRNAGINSALLWIQRQPRFDRCFSEPAASTNKRRMHGFHGGFALARSITTEILISLVEII